MPKYIPLLCSTPVVEALIAKRKTMTRRVIKVDANSKYLPQYNIAGYTFLEPKEFDKTDTEKMCSVMSCPYGNVGDVLWVRETFRSIEQDFGNPRYEYKATEIINLKDKWKPSLFMPKKACRFFLQIKSITVEQLNEISEEDSIAEGVESCNSVKQKFGCTPMVMKLYRDYERKDNSLIDYPCNGFDNPILSFQTLWESINGKDSWNKNPWVWVIEFEQIEKPENFI
jgi:hypothetical protein